METKNKIKIWGHQINFFYLGGHYENAEFTIKCTENDKFYNKKYFFFNLA